MSSVICILSGTQKQAETFPTAKKVSYNCFILLLIKRYSIKTCTGTFMFNTAGYCVVAGLRHSTPAAVRHCIGHVYLDVFFVLLSLKMC